MGRLGQQLASALLALLAVTAGSFLLVRVVPGDPVSAMLGDYASATDRAALAARMGLDRPLPQQMVDYYGGLLRGELGSSLARGEPVAALLARHWPATAVLAITASAIGLLLGLPLGAWAALRAGGAVDHAVQAAGLALVAMPSFVLGPLLAWVLAFQLGWLEFGGRGASALALPALTLGLGLAAQQARVARAAVADALALSHVRTAHAKGLGPQRIVRDHVLRLAALPIITLLGLEVGALLGGAVLTEAVFGWPGVGSLLAQAINQRDYPLLQGCVLAIALTYLGVNAVVEQAYRWLDPRTRDEG